jgi:hypothetical protein
MVCREAKARLNPQGEGSAAACCASPTGESPVPVGVGAPSRGPQALEGNLCVRARRQKPVKRRKPFSGKQARGPQHEVNPAASTDLQPAGRAAHVTAKATSPERDPKRAGDCGAVWGAARVQGHVRNVRGPSAQPESGQANSCKPKAKSSRAQREFEGIVVPHGAQVPTRPWGITRLEGRVPAAVILMERVSAREWPARPCLTTPSTFGRATKCDNCKGSFGPQPSGHREGQMHVRYPAVRGDALTVTCKLLAARTQPQDFGTAPHNAASRRPLVSRVREIRMHGLSGGVGSEFDLRA